MCSLRVLSARADRQPKSSDMAHFVSSVIQKNEDSASAPFVWRGDTQCVALVCMASVFTARLTFIRGFCMMKVWPGTCACIFICAYASANMYEHQMTQ